MKNIQRILFFAVCLCTAFTVQAQSLTVTGKVIDAEGLEVIGANITLKGASGVGSISDLSGNYRLKVDNAAKAILVFSYIGMKTQEVLVKGKAVINVTLQSDAKALDEALKWLPQQNEAKGDGLIFPLTHEGTINKILQKWAKDAGVIKHISFHVARHKGFPFLLKFNSLQNISA